MTATTTLTLEANNSRGTIHLRSHHKLGFKDNKIRDRCSVVTVCGWTREARVRPEKGKMRFAPLLPGYTPAREGATTLGEPWQPGSGRAVWPCGDSFSVIGSRGRSLPAFQLLLGDDDTTGNE